MKGFVTKCGGLKLLVIAALVMAICGIVVAEDADKKEVLTPLEQQMQKTISITFRDTPIDDVIRAIAEKANVDIIKSPQVTGTVTVTLTDVPLGEALNNILAAHGYGYVADKNVIRIAPMSELAQKEEVLVSRIYRITYADIKDVTKTVKEFISQRGSIAASNSTSNIIVTDTESRIKAIDTFIAEIDRITPQILVEARIYDITASDKLDLGIEWWVNRQSYWDADGLPTTNRQPYIQSTYAGAVDKTANASVGLLNFGIWNKDLDIDATIRAEQEDINAKLLANPRILVLDNEEAIIDIVQEYPYVERTITGNTVTETVRFKPIGTMLKVTPHVTRDGMLRLRIQPEFGVKVGDVALTGGAVPVVDTRKVDTIALVEHGQTVVIGGLRKKNVTQQTNKVPLLGDIPILGLLFRFEGEDAANSELVVFITPRIIEQPVLTEAEKEALKVTEFDRPMPVKTRAEKADEENQDKLPETIH
ncbi:MAG: secretin and TonB N-terminal domain-containing protein [Phycisphaerae bacterium]|nr:secretin and TonB N-terminal domain-containing protein [Phycisphaerae bacterium]